MIINIKSIIYINDYLTSDMEDRQIIEEIEKMDVTARNKEQMEIDVIIGTSDRMMMSEDNSLRQSVNLGKMNKDVLSTCNRCTHLNNMTTNKSVFCRECGSLLTDRHY